MRWVVASVFLLFSSAPTHAATTISRELIKSSQSNDKIEFYWAKPEGKGPFPTLLLIHPDQDPPKNGGLMFVQSGQIDYWLKKGFVAIAVSQPGYGGSEGRADFCGPRTQRAVTDVITHFQALSEIDSAHFFIYGGSRGAVVASMLATQGKKLAGVILKSGVYDFNEWADLRPWYDEIKWDMFLEIGWLTQEKLKARSASYLADKIHTPLLIIHGTEDSRAPIGIASKFAERVNQSGGKAQFIKISSEHGIPMPKVVGLMEEFMRRLI